MFEEIDETPRGKTCDAIIGIIEEGQEIMKEFKGTPALDAGLLAAAQAVEHYEIARYGTLKTWAAELGLNQAVKLLDTTLGEEKKTDETLTQARAERGQPARTGCVTCVRRHLTPPSQNFNKAPPYERGALFRHAKIQPKKETNLERNYRITVALDVYLDRRGRVSN